MTIEKYTMTKIKYALVLSGGGFKGAFQLGAINYLKENWNQITGQKGPMHFDLVAGVSVGALNGSFIAMNKIGELNHIWDRVAKEGAGVIYASDYIDTKNQQDKVSFKIDLESIRRKLFPKFEFEINVFEGLGLLFSKNKRQAFLHHLLESVGGEIANNLSDFKALADNSNLKKLLQEHLDFEQIVKCKFLSGFVSLENGNYYGVVHTDYLSNADFINGVLASTVMPTIWEPVPVINIKKETVRYTVDGGIRNISPLGDVINEINKDKEDVEYRIIIINCSTGTVELHQNPEKMNIVEIGVRSLNDIALTEIFNNDIEQFLRLNDLIKQLHENDVDIRLRNYDFQKGQRATGFLRPFKSVIIQPEEELGDSLSANKVLIEERRKLGRLKALEAFKDGSDSFKIS
jgi:NTE family protein